MPHRLHNSRLTAHLEHRQVEVVLQSARVARYVSARVLGPIVLSIEAKDTRSTLVALFQRLPTIARDATMKALADVQKSSRRTAIAAVLKSLPPSYLALAFLRHRASRRLREDREDAAGMLAMAARNVGLKASDMAGRLREPSADPLSEAEAKREFARRLFPPAFESDAREHLATMLRAVNWNPDPARADPEKLADIVALGHSEGKSARKILQDLMPAVDGVRSSAARVARTWTLFIAHEEQMKVNEELGDLLVGYQLRATISHTSRSWHAARHGRLYFSAPGPGQDGYYKMPRPPLEPEDPSERPAKAIRLAFN